MIVDILTNTVVLGIVGGVVAWILGLKSKAVPAG